MLTCTEVYSEEVILEIVDQMEMAVIHNAEQGGGSCHGFIINHFSLPFCQVYTMDLYLRICVLHVFL